VKSPASFDPKKLQAFEDWHFQQLPPEQKTALAIPFLEKAGLVAAPIAAQQRQIVEKVIAAAGDRIKVAGDILAFDDFFLKDVKVDPAVTEKAFSEPRTVELLDKWRHIVSTIEPFNAVTVEARLREFAASEGIKIGDIIHPLRLALTGKSVGLGLYDTAEILGRDTNTARITMCFVDLATQPSDLSPKLEGNSGKEATSLEPRDDGVALS
jgi:glutamyl-tRNA synthetase